MIVLNFASRPATNDGYNKFQTSSVLSVEKYKFYLVRKVQNTLKHPEYNPLVNYRAR